MALSVSAFKRAAPKPDQTSFDVQTLRFNLLNLAANWKNVKTSCVILIQRSGYSIQDRASAIHLCSNTIQSTKSRFKGWAIRQLPTNLKNRLFTCRQIVKTIVSYIQLLAGFASELNCIPAGMTFFELLIARPTAYFDKLAPYGGIAVRRAQSKCYRLIDDLLCVSWFSIFLGMDAAIPILLSHLAKKSPAGPRLITDAACVAADIQSVPAKRNA